MTGKSIAKRSKPMRFKSLDALPSAPPLSRKTKALKDAIVEQRALLDPDAGAIPAGFWDKAKVIEPEGTEQITLRLPRLVLGHFKATGKGYQSRISAVLSSYVKAVKKTG